MATRCYIGYSEAGYDNDTNPHTQQHSTVWAVYCHHDGYPDGVGKMLVDHYDDPVVIEELIEHGNVSILRPTIAESTFYSRDMHRDPTAEQGRAFASPQDYLRRIQQVHDIEHIYLHTHEAGWLHINMREGGEWKPLPGSAPPQNMGEENLAYMVRLYKTRLQKLPNESDAYRTDWLKALIVRNITSERRRVGSLIRLVKSAAERPITNDPSTLNESELARLLKLAAIRKD